MSSTGRGAPAHGTGRDRSRDGDAPKPRKQMGGGTNRTTGRPEGAIARGGRRAASFPLEVPPPRPARKPKRAVASEPVEERAPRDSLRRVQGGAAPRPARGKRPAEVPPRRTPSRRRRPGPQAVRDEILRLGGRRGARHYDELMRGADAFAEGRDRDALRIMRPLREEMPSSPSVRELYALALYRNGKFRDAARELEEYFSMTGDVTQHPVLMDCYRALGDHETVEARWRELGEESPSSELVTEGRIVLAGSLADRGRLSDAVTLLARRADGIKRVMAHHLRLWYALADLEERSGNLPAARARFDRIRKQDPGFADVAERLAALA